MQLSHVFIAFFMCDEAFPHVFIAFWHPQASFWEPIGLSWGLLFGMLEGPVELLGHPLGPKWSQKHQDEGHKSDLGSSGGGQGVSEALNGSILGRCSSLVLCYLVFWYVCFVRNVLCIMVAASHCSCFSQCVGRGQGSAVGAAEDHMTCMLDA